MSMLQGAECSSEPPAFALGSKAWDANILTHAILIVEPLAEVKLRTYALKYRICNVKEVLMLALERGILFTLVYSDEYLAEQRAALPPLNANDKYKLLSQPYLDEAYCNPIVSYSLTDTTKLPWLQYQQRVRDLLCRPHLVTLLSMDAFVSRLVREFHPLNLEDHFLCGPSSSLFCFGRTYPYDMGYGAEYATYDELNLLLGVTKDAFRETRSWWPSPDLFCLAGFWVDEWTASHEEWFRE
ncbi:hypothetical protein PsYK624_138160 [Phanerochaete sordida]|uniref:Uncharacterized protein n=1 Tax=Phanerochaete sordida TaxID=48140 RepID=A0A9P3GLM8_9APHY|nr:hypothetical protein PsYK624_138160 [Phanerochaete sordida]